MTVRQFKARTIATHYLTVMTWACGFIGSALVGFSMVAAILWTYGFATIPANIAANTFFLSAASFAAFIMFGILACIAKPFAGKITA